MTVQQFEQCFKTKTPIYEISVKPYGTKIHKKKVSYSYFNCFNTAIEWINECVWYGPDNTRGMYVSGDKIDQCKLKLINCLRQEELKKIKMAESAIARLCRMEEELK